MNHKRIRYAGSGLLMAIVITAALSVVVMLLWNALMPELFGLHTVTYLQSAGLLILTHILLRGGGPMHHRWKHERYRHMLDERIAAMSAGERERFFCHGERTPPESPADNAPSSAS